MGGRLSYDPTIINNRFKGVLRSRFSGVDSAKLFSAWQNASMVYPVTTGFHWGSLDFQWYIEGCKSQPKFAQNETGFHWGSLDFQWYIEGCKSQPKFAQNETGFHDVNRFITLGVHPKSGNQSIPDYVKMVLADSTTTLKTPLQVSEILHMHAEKALEGQEGVKDVNDKELQFTLNDIKTVSYLGKYYAHKISGSTYVALFWATKNKEYQELAIEELTEALAYWKKYTKQALEQNHNPLWTNRVGIVDWKQITEWVEQDIEIANTKLK